MADRYRFFLSSSYGRREHNTYGDMFVTSLLCRSNKRLLGALSVRNGP